MPPGQLEWNRDNLRLWQVLAPCPTAPQHLPHTPLRW